MNDKQMFLISVPEEYDNYLHCTYMEVICKWFKIYENMLILYVNTKPLHIHRNLGISELPEPILFSTDGSLYVFYRPLQQMP